jgi:asparagine N-glycosylation enzyme membrane subunit Stt3
MDFLGFIIGMAVLWGVLYVLVYPVTESFARGRLEAATGMHGKNINPESIPIRYYSFFGSLIFTIIGFMMGLLFGMYFIGFSLRGRDLPGVFSLVVASFSGSMLLEQPRNAGFVPPILWDFLLP